MVQLNVTRNCVSEFGIKRHLAGLGTTILCPRDDTLLCRALSTTYAIEACFILRTNGYQFSWLGLPVSRKHLSDFPATIQNTKYAKKKWCQCALFRKCQPVLVVHTRVQEQGLSYKSINLIENSSGPPDCHRIRMHPTSPTLRNEFFLAIVLLANVFGQSIWEHFA